VRAFGGLQSADTLMYSFRKAEKVPPKFLRPYFDHSQLSKMESSYPTVYYNF